MTIITSPEDFCNSIDPSKFPVKLPDWIFDNSFRPQIADLQMGEIDEFLGKPERWDWKGLDYCRAYGFSSENGRPFQVRFIAGKEGQRYDAPPRAGAEVFHPSIPQEIRIKIQDQYNVEIPDGDFWPWFSSSSLPLFIAEGPAKVLTLLSAGHPAVCGYGIWGGVSQYDYEDVPKPRGKRKNSRDLIQTIKTLKPKELGEFYQGLDLRHRTVYIVPDQDSKTETRFKVSKAVLTLGRLLCARGARVKVVQLNPSYGKGIDDAVLSQGWDVIGEGIKSAVTFKEYSIQIKLSQSLADPFVSIRSNSMDTLNLQIPTEGIVISDAPMGTGKTKLAAQLTAGRTMLAAYPLRSLAVQAAEVLNADYKLNTNKHRETGTYATGNVISDRLTVCYDSLPKLDLEKQFDGLQDLFLDEITHGFRHAFLGSTCKRNRIDVIGALYEAIKTADRVIAFDADFTRVELDILKEIRGEDDLFYIQNLIETTPWDVQWIETFNHHGAIEKLARVVTQDTSDGLIHWATDSKAGSFKVERYLSSLGIQCAVINSDTVSWSDYTLAKSALEGDFATLRAASVKVIVTSPSVSQGVSWESDTFSAVIGTFTGCSVTPRVMAQMLGRVRTPVNRYVWCASYSLRPDPLSKFQSPAKLRNYLHKISTLNQVLYPTAPDEFVDKIIDIACRLIIEDNWWRKEPANALKGLLTHRGHDINTVKLVSMSGAEFKEASKEWKEDYLDRIARCKTIETEEALELTAKKQSGKLTADESFTLEKWGISQFLGIEPQFPDIEFAKRAGASAQLLDIETLVAPDAESYTASVFEQNFNGISYDANLQPIRRKLLQELGVLEFAQKHLTVYYNQDSPEVQEIYSRAMHWQSSIKEVFNLWLPNNLSPCQVVFQLLWLLGLKTTSIRKREDGRVLRLYLVDQGIYDQMIGYVEARYQKRLQASSDTDPAYASNSQSRLDQAPSRDRRNRNISRAERRRQKKLRSKPFYGFINAAELPRRH